MRIGKQLKRVSTMLSRRMQSVSRQNRPEEISGVFAWVIAFLLDNADRPIYQKDIEREFGLSRSAVSRALTQMEEKGLILRANSTSDCRLKQLLTTEKAKAVSQQLFFACQTVENELVKGFSPEELSELNGYLKRLEDNLRVSLANDAYSEKGLIK